MLAIRNRTPFPAAIVPYRDKNVFDHAAVVIKGTFALLRGAEIADQQLPLTAGDQYHGEAGRSSLRYESDYMPPKPGTDVVLNGHAYPAARGDTHADVELRIGRYGKTVRVFGDRVYYRTAGVLAISDPQPFQRMPLVYERAYGGADISVGETGAHPYEERNDLGVGFVAPGSKRNLDGERLPNLEDPGAPIKGPADRPAPAGFGTISRHWHPRRTYAGTYDDRWRRERCPLLPEDFDPRFFHGAPPDLVLPPLHGGERVAIQGASPRGPIELELPVQRFDVRVMFKGKEQQVGTKLDSVVFEPDENRVVLVWRASIPCGHDLLYIDHVVITQVTA